MTPASPDYAILITRLRTALENTADALACADLDRLLACEASLEAALAQLRTEPLPPAMRAQLRKDADFVRLALTRCRRLGLALTEFARLGMQAQGVAPGYGARGALDLGLHSLDTTA